MTSALPGRMTPELRQSLLIAVLMLAAAVAAWALQPARRTDSAGPPVDLEFLVPRTFGPWRVDDALLPLVVSPDVQEKLDTVYDRMLTRTYVDGAGERVILLLAYTRRQIGGDLQVHRPEGCYAAQGFVFERVTPVDIALGGKKIPAVRMVAVRGNRVEPITYWARVDQRLVRGYFDQALARISSGMQGRNPDGLLFRVSSLDRDTAHAQAIHDRFLRDLMAEIPADRRAFLIGQ